MPRNNNLAHHYFYGLKLGPLAMVVKDDKIGDVEQCTTFAGRFDGHGNAPVQWGAHRSMQQVHVYTLMPLGTVIGQIFTPHCPGGYHGHQCWHKKLSCGVVALLSKASVQKAQNWPSTQRIEATNYVERSNALIKAEELSNFSGYQTLTTDNNRWSY